jgi:hypothetical protein
MSHWVLLVAPLALASFVMLFGFVGCRLDSIGEAGNQPDPDPEPDPELEQYKIDVTNNPNLVSYWRLGEPPGETTAVDSKGDNDGTYVGGLTLGQPGLLVVDTDTAAQFDGSTGFVNVPRNDDSLNPATFTVEAIADVAGGDDQLRAVVSSRDIDGDAQKSGYILYASDQNKWEAWVGDGSLGAWQVVTGPDVTPGQHYLAMTYNGTTLNLYVDPVDDTPASAAVPYVPNTAQELRIGAGVNEADPLEFFNGVIDEVAVYDVDLDFSVIQTHFAIATTGAAPQ